MNTGLVDDVSTRLGGKSEFFLITVPPEDENPMVLAVPSPYNSKRILPIPIGVTSAVYAGSPGRFKNSNVVLAPNLYI
jgi:hypothetical protein